MAKVQKVEDLVAWQKAEALAELVYSACRSGELASDFGLRDQMQRAAVSVMSNIAEGFERKTTADFSHFLFIAKGSLGELKSQLFLAARLKFIPPSVFASAHTLAEETGRIIAGLIAHLAQKQDEDPRKPTTRTSH